MAYITMCKDVTCKERNKCYRFTANKSQIKQSYRMLTKTNGVNCKDFLKND